MCRCGNLVSQKQNTWHSSNTDQSKDPQTDLTINEIDSLDMDDSDQNISLFPDVIAFRQKFKSNFIFAHVNINSFRHKFAFIHELLRKNVVDYLAISESKIDESFPNNQFNIEGYSLYRQDCTSSSGGLLIYLRSDLPQRRLENIECNSNGIESLCIEIIVGKCKTIIACVYKHPKVANEIFKDCMSEMADKLLISCQDLILLGDMNCCPNKSNTIKDFCDMYDLSNIIKDPTCHKGQTPTLLDVILVSNPKRYAGVLNSICNLSDFHNIIGAATRRFAPSMIPRCIFYRSYKHFDESRYINDIAAAPFHVSDIFDNVEDVAWFSSKLISDVIDDHAPIRSKCVKSDSVPYMNSRLRKAQYKRNMARNKFRLFGKAHWEENRRHRNNVVSIRKQSMSKYFSEKCAKKDKTFWSTIKPFMTNKNSENGKNVVLNENDQIVNDPKEISDIFNSFFSTVASTIGFDDEIQSSESSINKHKDHPSIIKIKGRFTEKANSFKFKPISSTTIMKKMRSINIRKATGYDNIPGKLIRIAHKELALPLTGLLNRCIGKNVFPSIMKNAEVSPVYKKLDNMRKNNYRPVSVLTTVSKLFESVMNDQLYNYFVELFDDLLSAFRKGYSCQSLLVRFVEDMKTSLDKGHTVGAVFMDLSKAFDCLPHGLLISKLSAYGLDLSACDLLASYLSDRKQRVKICNTRSDWVNLRKGVPQGSILGPLLFNIFMNDMFYFIEKCILYNYADDNSVSTCAPNLGDVICSLKLDCGNAIKWFKDNGMQANADKFQFMLVSPRITDAISINICENVTITSEPHVKVLGIIIDRNLNFSEQVSASCKKAARQLNALARISNFLDIDTRKIIFNSFIRSNFSYCPLVWHFCGKQNNMKIEKIQERALRIIYRDFESSYDDLLEVSNNSTALIGRLKILIMEVFKSIKQLNPPCMNDLFEIKDTPYSMRNPLKIVQPWKRTTTFGLKSVSYLGPKIWNDLPIDFNDVPNMSVDVFKHFLKSWNGPSLVSTSHYV